MSSHADKAAEHAQHAGSSLSIADGMMGRNVEPDAVGVVLAQAQVEATLSVAQRLADVAEAIREGIDAGASK